MFLRANYWWLPDELLVVAGCFLYDPGSHVAAPSQEPRIAWLLTKHLTKHFCKAKAKRANARLLFEKFVAAPRGDRGAVPDRFHAGEKESRGDFSYVAGPVASELFTWPAEKGSPGRRPSHAERSPPWAIGRRSTGDRRSTGRVAWESPGVADAGREILSRSSPRPPPGDDTLALGIPRDRRGASAGVAASYAGPRQDSRTMRPLALGRGAVPCTGQEPVTLHVPCPASRCGPEEAGRTRAIILIAYMPNAPQGFFGLT